MKFEPPFSLPAIPREHTMVGVGGFMESQNFVSDTSGWRLTGEGNFEGNDGTFRGSITGATGTFSGDLSAAGGTFSGDLTAAGGTFTGALSAATGTFAGSLSAATGTFTGDLSGSTITGGSLNIGSGTFEVSTSGVLTATSATLEGNLTNAQNIQVAKTDGTVTGWWIGETGNLWVGSNVADPILSLGNQVGGSTSLRWEESNGAFYFKNDGTDRVSFWAAGTVLNTCATGTGDNIEINGYGVLVKDTSSGRFKNIDSTIDIAEYLDPAMVDNLHPKMWAFKNDTDQHPHISLISEEANEISPFFVTKSFDENGNLALSGLKDRAIMSLLIVALQDVRERLAALEA